MSYTDADVQKHAEMLKNRVAKSFKKLAPGFAREQTEVFRLYDWDIPEVRVAVDWYAGHLVVAEYTRDQTATVPHYTRTLAERAADALSVPHDRVHCKGRRTRPKEGERYERAARSNHRLAVKEHGLTFLVNLEDFLDTGLFADHRETRLRVGQEAKGKRVLNLFSYTGSFSVYAAMGGAKAVTTVDVSRTYLDWAQENFEENGLRASAAYTFVKDDVREHLIYAHRRGERYDLVICDPPSFSTGRERESFDVQRDHPELIADALAMLSPGGVLYFSTNHQRFEPRLERLPQAEDITSATVPRDYRNRQVHRCFRWQLGAAQSRA